MATAASDVPQELTSIIISLQETIRNVKRDVEKKQEDIIFDPTQPIGHLLDNTDSTDIILSLAKPTKETTTHLQELSAKLSTLQRTLTEREQWHPPPSQPPPAVPCSTDFLDLSDLSTAVDLISNVVRYSNPSKELTPQVAFAKRTWTWDPLWREFFSHDAESHTSTYLSRWYFDPRREVWQHANMADSGLLPDEAQQRLGSWEDWRWDGGCGAWGLDVSHELEDGQREVGGRLCVFASRWQERDGGWVYVGGRGG
ncbi:hypothetical protein EKO04_003420 [Ascochyta lentis]|uniref:Uncharacterized protein n=1 Tax=Ascochyta lentis TaxID=205686 RepID=A0A8H7J5F2_9PLEO|nr:hypothetical protein EKO04_003420 [Ascochyta lentis]